MNQQQMNQDYDWSWVDEWVEEEDIEEYGYDYGFEDFKDYGELYELYKMYEELNINEEEENYIDRDDLIEADAIKY